MWINVADVKSLSQQPGSAARSVIERKKFQAAVLLCEKATAESPSTLDILQGTLFQNYDQCSEEFAKKLKKNVTRENFKAASVNRDSVHCYLQVQSSKVAMVREVTQPARKENVEAELDVEILDEPDDTEEDGKNKRSKMSKPLVLSPSKGTTTTTTGHAITKYLGRS